MRTTLMLRQDRYREFRVVTRLYTHLTMSECAGVYHDIDIPNRPKGDLTVPCVACPSPGFNLPDDWRETPEHLRCVFDPC